MKFFVRIHKLAIDLYFVDGIFDNIMIVIFNNITNLHN